MAEEAISREPGVVYMPLIQAPAHDFDTSTLNTVVQRCMHISEKLGQKYTVISVDQALYFKLMDLKWCGRSNLQRAWEVILCARIPLL
jgi:hypothetical protein